MKIRINKRTSVVIALIVMVGFLFILFSAGYVHAQAEADQPATTPGLRGIDLITCGITDFFTGPCIAKGIAWVGFIILSAVSWLLVLVGLIFDGVIQNIFKPELYDLPALHQAWTLSRDMANLFFIFILLSIAIATILRVETYGAKRLLPKLIIAALFINFSFLLTQYIIFSANTLAKFFIPGAESGAPSQLISEKIVAGLNPQQFLSSIDIKNLADYDKLIEESKALEEQRSAIGSNSPRGDAIREQIADNEAQIAALEKAVEDEVGVLQVLIDTFIATIFGIIFIATAAFVLAAASILLILRVVVLWILLVLSPIAFLFMVLPRTAQYATRWWDALLNNALFPVFFFFLFLIPLAMIGDGSLGEFYNVNQEYKDQAIKIPLILHYITIITLTLLTLSVAKELGAWGSQTMISWSKAGSKWAQGTFAGAPARRIARKTAGFASSAALGTKAAERVSRIPLVRQALRPLAAGVRVGEKQAEEDAKRIEGLSVRERVKLLPTLSKRSQAFAFRKMDEKAKEGLFREMGAEEQIRFGKQMKGFGLEKDAAAATKDIKQGLKILFDAPSEPPEKGTPAGQTYQDNLTKLFKELRPEQLGGFNLERESRDEAMKNYLPEAVFKGLDGNKMSRMMKTQENDYALSNIMKNEAREQGMVSASGEININRFAEHIRTNYENDSAAQWLQSSPGRKFFATGERREKEAEEERDETREEIGLVLGPSGRPAREELESPGRQEPREPRERVGFEPPYLEREDLTAGEYKEQQQEEQRKLRKEEEEFKRTKDFREPPKE